MAASGGWRWWCPCGAQGLPLAGTSITGGLRCESCEFTVGAHLRRAALCNHHSKQNGCDTGVKREEMAQAATYRKKRDKKRERGRAKNVPLVWPIACENNAHLRPARHGPSNTHAKNDTSQQNLKASSCTLPRLFRNG